MLTISAMIAMTNRKVVTAMSTYRLAYPRTTDDTGWRVHEAIVYGGSKPAHVRIRARSDDADAMAEVACTCTYFTMNLETALAVQGSAKPVKAGGVMPMKRNPALKPGLCPHLFVFALNLTKSWAADKAEDEKPQASVNPRLRTLK